MSVRVVKAGNAVMSTIFLSECGLPPLVANTIVHGNLRSVGNKIQYVCSTDVTAVFTAECLQTGLWSPIPVCPVGKIYILVKRS